MKKIMSMLLICLFLLSNTAVWAESAPSLDFLKYSDSIKNVEQNGTLSLKLNEPFGLLDLLAKDDNSKDVTNSIDVVKLVESLFDTTMSINTKAEISNGGKSYLTETHIKSNVPFKANNNLEGDIKTNCSVWAEFDFSDEDAPYFDMIMTHPFATKYITADSDLMAQNGGYTSVELSEGYKAFFDGKALSGLSDEMVESIKRNATVTGNSRKVKIVFNDAGLKTYIADAVKSVFDKLDESMLSEFDDEALNNAMRTVPIFGKEAMVMEYTLDYKGRISEECAVLNVDLNIYDLMTALGEEEPPEETGITRENCNMNFTVTSKTDIKYDTVKIERPVITEENSIDIFEYEDPYYYDEPEYDDEYYEEDYYPYAYAKIDSNSFENGELNYVQLRSFLEDIGYSVSYDNGKIAAELDSEYVKYKSIYFTIGSDITYTENGDVLLTAPLFVKDGVTYISIADCENLTNMIKEYISYYFESNDGYLEFVDYDYLYSEWY